MNNPEFPQAKTAGTTVPTLVTARKGRRKNYSRYNPA
jgi:hypothetical protein